MMRKRVLSIFVFIFAGLSVALGVSVGKIGTELDEYRIAQSDWREELQACEDSVGETQERLVELEQIQRELQEARQLLQDKEQQLIQKTEELSAREAEMSRLKAQVVRLQSRVPAQSGP